MPEVWVESRKWDGSLHRRAPAVELGSDGAGTWLWLGEGVPVVTATGSFPARAALRLLQPGRCWSAWFVPPRADLGRSSQVYVDVTTPTLRRGDTFELVDLDLDVEQLGDAEVRVLDRDELVRHGRAMGYPRAVVERAEQVALEVAGALRRRRPPFDGIHRRWLDVAGRVHPG